jgi:hypothetical protein
MKFGGATVACRRFRPLASYLGNVTRPIRESAPLALTDGK